MSGIMYFLYKNVTGRGDLEAEGRDRNQPHHDKAKHRTLSHSYIGLTMFVLAHIGLVKRSDDSMAEYVYDSFPMAVYISGCVASLVALIRMNSRSCGWRIDNTAENNLETGLLLISCAGQLITSLFTIIACSLSADNTAGIVVALEYARTLQVFPQVIFLYDALYRIPPPTFQPSCTRQLVIYLIFCNITLFWISIYDLKNVYVHLISNCFYGADAWSIILHLATPLEIYFRFHSAIVLLEIWERG
uniref:Otopetrin-2-like n=1 Tax=Saccoglossus kowalevskii TaxID=10224 RepID=A0ABM0MIB5_SACKO|nr:PREDICTED: otopetrin-2-like [Saccoglossus kowalevskii]